jgi:hypothetical protein
MAIGGYFIGNYCWLLMVILSMVIGDYSINGYW